MTYISTRSTFTPQGSVAWSSTSFISFAIASRSVRRSDIVFVPRTFLSVVAAKSLVEVLKFATYTKSLMQNILRFNIIMHKFHLNNRFQRILNSIVYHSIDTNRYRVSRQNLLRWNIKRNRSQIHFDILIDARQYKKQTRTTSSAFTVCFIIKFFVFSGSTILKRQDLLTVIFPIERLRPVQIRWPLWNKRTSKRETSRRLVRSTGRWQLSGRIQLRHFQLDGIFC